MAKAALPIVWITKDLRHTKHMALWLSVGSLATQSFNPSSVVHSSLKVQTPGMFAYTISEREEGSNVFNKLIDKTGIGKYEYFKHHKVPKKQH